ncbi:helix-turn-helix domain-containing protein [Aeromonas bivalvium]|uniref:helix-turn-helix domain-containing protein n=1 Tax=Aeromonas bivalvium TaxID=440079 RepID=UPI0038D04D97
MQGLQLLVALLLLGRIALSGFGWSLSAVYLQAPVTAYLLLLVLAHARLPQQGRRGEVSGQTADRVAEPMRDDSLQPLFDELERVLARGAFRDPALSLGKLAQLCGLSTHQASSAINGCSGGNFYDWLNRHRVEEAKRLLQESDETVASVCYQAGFNSKSTFNTAFRRHTGQTPSEFRRRPGVACAAPS